MWWNLFQCVYNGLCEQGERLCGLLCPAEKCVRQHASSAPSSSAQWDRSQTSASHLISTWLRIECVWEEAALSEPVEWSECWQPAGDWKRETSQSSLYFCSEIVERCCTSSSSIGWVASKAKQVKSLGLSVLAIKWNFHSLRTHRLTLNSGVVSRSHRSC